MGKQGKQRKSKLRPQKRAKLDDDLTVLASVIGEFNLDNNAFGWFRHPWRNGRWAAQLAAVAAVHKGIKDRSVPKAIMQDVCGLVAKREDYTSSDYADAGELYRILIQPKIDTPMANLLAAACRCLQLKIAHSDGGGENYNELLKGAFLPVDPDLVADLVLEYRCLDSIGVSHHYTGDRNDRQRQAFRIAWERGLYLAAYSLPPAY